MNIELEYLLRNIELMENIAPSQWNAAKVAWLKAKFLPRLKNYLNGNEVKIETKADGYDLAKDIFK